MQDSENRYFDFGTSNPTIMNKPFWMHMVCNPHLTAENIENSVRELDNIGKFDEIEPIWSFARHGFTLTYLPDRPNGPSLICIGGAQGCRKDSNFQIYNDVVVINNPRLMISYRGMKAPLPSNFPLSPLIKIKGSPFTLGTSNYKNVTIYGYPENLFLPTYEHTATYIKTPLKSEYIFIIGGLGYTFTDSECVFPLVYRLDLSNFIMQQLITMGDRPLGYVNTEKGTSVEIIGPRQYIHVTMNDRRNFKLDVATSTWENY